MRGADLEQLCRADAYSCGVTIPPSGEKHPNARLGLFAARTFEMDVVVGPHYEEDRLTRLVVAPAYSKCVRGQSFEAGCGAVF